MKKKSQKRCISALLCFAMLVTMCLSNIGGTLAEAASSITGNAPEGTYSSTSILKVVGLSKNSSECYDSGTFNGYIQTNYATETAVIGSDYLCVQFTLDSSSTATDDTKLFNFQPFNSGWQGWDNNYLTLSQADYDAETGVYSVYIATQKVVQSLSTGTLYGINLSFGEDAGITITDYCYMTESTGDEEETLSEADYQLDEAVYILNITGTDLVNAGYDYDELQTLITSNSGTVKFYVHISEANEYSWLQARSGSVNSFNGNASDTVSGSGTGASNKYLIAKSCTKQSSSYYAIKYNSDGSAEGSAGTGNYVFPSNAITASKITTVENYSLSIAIKTSGTEAEALGLVFSDGTSFTVNSDGTLTKGFTVPTCESADGVFEEEVGSGQVWEQTASEQRANLKLTLDYINNDMDSSKYTEDSWADLMEALEVAQAVYDDATKTASEYKSARDTLENVKANLIFDTETDDSGAQEFRELDAEMVIAEMGVGINLGNTMDGHSGFTPSETAWQSVVTTQEYIQALHDAGYNTLRIPVTWGTMIDDDNDYAINENWMSRVQDIVDYCMELDMYVIINVHHDGAEATGWLYMGEDDIDSVMEKFEAVWRQIAERFKDYDEHLIFESMNEITCGDGDSYKNATEAVNYDTPIIVNFNQLFVNVVRSTGSNNTKRYLAVVSHYANNGSSSLFTMPNDTYNDTNRLMFALHVYSSSGWDGVVTRLQSVAKKFTSQGIPCYLGEYGVTNATSTVTESGYNDIYRALYSEVVGKACQVAGVVPVVWDQGYGDDKYQTGLYSYWDRSACEPIFQSIVSGMLRGTLLEASDLNLSYDFSDIIANYASNYATYDATEDITDFTLSADSLELAVGDWTTVTAEADNASTTDDVILWSSDDSNIATVYNGKIHATGIGETTVRAYTDSGTVEKTITVVVGPSSDEEGVTITTDQDTYEVTEGKGVFIEASASDGGALTYESSNTDIVTVSRMGKLVGIAIGEAYVTITADTGVTKTVKVNVTDGTTRGEITVGVQVYYNDDSAGYWSVETGDSVTITEEGQYTLTFDCEDDLSSAAIAAGVDSLENLTAIYLKDLAVDSGEATVSAVDSCYIAWDKITVGFADGTSQTLTITDTSAHSAIKSGGVFDTNDPINGWDGSAVAEASANSSHVANFTTSQTPTSITITFTISNLVFSVAEDTRENPATSLDAASDVSVTYSAEDLDSTVTISVLADPIDTDTLVSFVSADKSIVQVDEGAVSVDDNGNVSADVKLISEGTTLVTAMTENGEKVNFVFSTYDLVTASEGWTTTVSDVEGATTGSITLTGLFYGDESLAACWNDYCTAEVTITSGDSTITYIVGGSKVTWKDCDYIMADEPITITFPIEGDDLTITVTGTSWTAAEGTSVLGQNTAYIGVIDYSYSGSTADDPENTGDPGNSGTGNSGTGNSGTGNSGTGNSGTGGSDADDLDADDSDEEDSGEVDDSDDTDGSDADDSDNDTGSESGNNNTSTSSSKKTGDADVFLFIMIFAAGLMMIQICTRRKRA